MTAILSQQRAPRHVARIATMLAATMTLGLSACTWPADVNRAYDSELAHARFEKIPASKFASAAWLNDVEPNGLRMQKIGHKTRYVFVDPLVCNCAYLGDAKAYSRIRQFDAQQTARTTPQTIITQ